jgi:hypothetical protein
MLEGQGNSCPASVTKNVGAQKTLGDGVIGGQCK